ncbi:hypothetical protein R6Q57_012729 [Mikania cordata]
MELPNGGVHIASDFDTPLNRQSSEEPKTEQVDEDDYSHSNGESDEIEKFEIHVKEEENNGSCEVEQTVVFPPNPQFPKPEAPSGVLIVYTDSAEKS